MSMQKNYIELLKKIPKRIFSLEKTDKIIKDKDQFAVDKVLSDDKSENNNEWTQEYEVIYNSYVLER
jgi:hypothetical protein